MCSFVLPHMQQTLLKRVQRFQPDGSSSEQHGEGSDLMQEWQEARDLKRLL